MQPSTAAPNKTSLVSTGGGKAGGARLLFKRHQGILLLLVCSLLAACSRDTQLTVFNESSSTLTNVVASGSVFSQSLSPLAPGAQQQVAITPGGESGLKLAFDADGQHFAPPEQGYFENGYSVSAIIAPDYTATVDATLPKTLTLRARELLRLR